MEPDIIGAGSLWIPEEQYRTIRESVPIVCVDVLLMRSSDRSQVGLIHRATYDGGFGWCLVGGAVLKDEALLDAVGRHVVSTLGKRLSLDRSTLELRTVIEYYTSPNLGEFHDPRKHAVALTYLGLCEGEAEAMGEALAFDWFQVDQLAEVPFGFGQGEVAKRVLSGRRLP